MFLFRDEHIKKNLNNESTIKSINKLKKLQCIIYRKYLGKM